ncbi:hypothetical protein [Ectothiorhodospira lacustris]|uniref:hypothetical protein n=1 Tax=Ectothiorhodospira lacustris TaxID=2899127 RepID=UPI001EE99406|nr:hypothetical protein [Ectothiorhodospira lacustris]MCG5499490.1 hypothetical protein [Ectothiorhodospira lacustris]MCG5511068.1 hypothetical protein [Ectothiorhodospira lacustris]MCG5522924.1 hypothetical protein [Ectothiorhodospira lacustris]
MNSTRQEDSHGLIRDQRIITNCALEVIEGIRIQRGKPLQPRDRMALKLLTPRNAALMMKGNRRHLGCRQVSFEILTDDVGLGAYRLIPVGVHVLNPERGWWNDDYGVRRFLWNLYLGEDPIEGMQRILERLFKVSPQGLRSLSGSLDMQQAEHDIQATVRPDLSLYIRRHKGSVETSLRRLNQAQALYRVKDLGIDAAGQGRMALVFGSNQRYAVSFAVERA